MTRITWKLKKLVKGEIVTISREATFYDNEEAMESIMKLDQSFFAEDIDISFEDEED